MPHSERFSALHYYNYYKEARIYLTIIINNLTLNCRKSSELWTILGQKTSCTTTALKHKMKILFLVTVMFEQLMS